MKRHQWNDADRAEIWPAVVEARGNPDDYLKLLTERLGFKVTRSAVEGQAREQLREQLSSLASRAKHLSDVERAVVIARRRAAAEDRIEVASPPPDGLTTEELLEERIRRFDRKRAHEVARRLIDVKVPDDVIGIAHLGDPHVDDDGCDIRQVRDDLTIVKQTPGLYAATVGDLQNNWIGRLAHLWGQQSTSAREAKQLVRWMLEEPGSGKWVYIVGGNHDLWSGAGDPLEWIAAQQSALYQESEARVALRFPNSLEVRVNCRHDFAGHSMWNPAHAAMKASLLGVRDHVFIGGHKHVSAYGVLKDPDDGTTMHSIIVAGYKVYDRHARDKGFRDQRISPSCVTVIDSRLPATHPDLVKVFWDVAEGANYLSWRRARAR